MVARKARQVRVGRQGSEDGTDLQRMTERIKCQAGSAYLAIAKREKSGSAQTNAFSDPGVAYPTSPFPGI